MSIFILYYRVISDSPTRCPVNTGNRTNRCRNLLASALLALLLTACATPGPPPAPLQWPPSPAEAQVTWNQEIRDYRDAGIRKGFWRRLADFVVGESDLRLGRPYGIFVDNRGRLFIADNANGIVHFMDSQSMKYLLIGTGEPPLFKSPIAITGDDNENIYITDSAGAMVYRYDVKGNVLTTFTGSLERPTGIAFNRNNRLLYVTDTTAHQVVVLDLNGKERFRIGSHGAAPGQFNHPTDLFIDNAGTLYVTDPLNARIQLFSSAGVFQKAFGQPGDTGGEFVKPKGVAVDSGGNIYIADSLRDAVQVFDPAGRYRFAFGATGDGPGQFWMPSGVFIDRSDRIYVADTYNRRIQVFSHVRPTALQGKDR
ncbi:6-bladed beta-propeller [Oryzomonas sagensis]|uniref:6-bladed beta-propeller n=1 Tax=Oryzomonas sagensis TaxID=2603857 RepID=A0ABQ6TRD0_9BACT|nr:6-bladed beta-propeller [Oryzomonas sagensis]